MFPYAATARLFELDLTGEKQTHAPEFDDSGGIDIGVLGVSAALTGEFGLRQPIARRSEAAQAAFLRTVVRRHDDGELVFPPRLVTGELMNPAPGAVQNRPVESGFLADVASRLVDGSLGRAGHVFGPQILEDEQPDMKIVHQGPAGFVGHVGTDPGFVECVPGRPPVGLGSAVRAFFPPRGDCLPAFALSFGSGQPLFLDGGEVELGAVANRRRNRHTPVDAPGLLPQSRLVQALQLGSDLGFGLFRRALLDGEGQMPLSRFDAENNRRGRLPGRTMCVDPDFPHGELFGSNRQADVLFVRNQLEQFAGEQDRLPALAGFDLRAALASPGEEPLVGLPPAVSSVSQHDGGDFPQKGGLFGDEMGILLIPGDRHSAQRRGLAGEPAEIAVLADLGVVNEPLATDPAQKNLLLFGRRVDAEFIAGQHAVGVPW